MLIIMVLIVGCTKQISKTKETPKPEEQIREEKIQERSRRELTRLQRLLKEV